MGDQNQPQGGQRFSVENGGRVDLKDRQNLTIGRSLLDRGAHEIERRSVEWATHVDDIDAGLTSLSPEQAYNQKQTGDQQGATHVSGG